MERPDRLIAEFAGFSLMEMLIVLLIIGILAGVGIPYYLKGIESSKADEAVSLLRAIASAHRLCAMNSPKPNGNFGWINPSLTPGGWYQTNLCPLPGTPCPGTPPNECDLIACRYLSDQNWDSLAYVFRVCDPAVPAQCCAWAGLGLSGMIACAGRKTSGPAGTTQNPYSGWEYWVDMDGRVTPGNSLGGSLPPSPPP